MATPAPPTLHGWIVIDKPVGPGSTPMVSAVKRALREGGYPKVKVGHGGTLDPLASGVLPIAIGEATKLAGRMLDADKAYDFTIAFGAETDTLDLEGAVIATSDVRPTLADIEGVLPRFTGPIAQAPPAYSAIKIDGERAYARARAGETVEMAMRYVTIHELFLRHPGPVPGSTAPQTPAPAVKWTPEQVRGDEVQVEHITLTARVSKGTYIRSLARDVAQALGTVGHVTMLRRTKAGPFTLEQAISLDMLADLGKAQRLKDVTLPLTAGLDDIPALPVSPDQAGSLSQGRKLIGIAANDGLHLAIDGIRPIALVEVLDREVRIVRGFNL